MPNLPDDVAQEAYCQEVSSAGFWPGTGLGYPAFYSYAYPTPEGFKDAIVQPEAAFFYEGLGEFVLPYEAVREAVDPDQALLVFLHSTYATAATILATATRHAWQALRCVGPLGRSLTIAPSTSTALSQACSRSQAG